jgi:hypothetical protein
MRTCRSTPTANRRHADDTRTSHRVLAGALASTPSLRAGQPHSTRRGVGGSPALDQRVPRHRGVPRRSGGGKASASIALDDRRAVHVACVAQRRGARTAQRQLVLVHFRDTIIVRRV